MTLPPPLEDDAPRPFTPRVVPSPRPMHDADAFALCFAITALAIAGAVAVLRRLLA